jgi:hypothetical protein
LQWFIVAIKKLLILKNINNYQNGNANNRFKKKKL